MSRPKLRVQHMVAGHTVRQYGTYPTSDLLGVAYRILYSPDTEFPVTVPQIDLFTRFFIRRPGSNVFVVRIWSVGADGFPETLVTTSGPYQVNFPAGQLALDRLFKVRYLQVMRPGTFAFQLCRRRTKGWQAGEWGVLATEYISIERG